MIPANLHYNEPNENISSLTEGSLKVVDENTPLCGSLVGISSFGFGGSNVHSIVKTSEKLKKPHGECEKPRLFIYGSRTKAAAEQVLKMVQKYPKDMDLHALWNESANMSLKTHPYRGFTVLNSGQKISDIQVSFTDIIVLTAVYGFVLHVQLTAKVIWRLNIGLNSQPTEQRGWESNPHSLIYKGCGLSTTTSLRLLLIAVWLLFSLIVSCTLLAILKF